jgi:hypothetical protein
VLVTGTSISTVFRGSARRRRTVSGGRGVAQTAIHHREERARKRPIGLRDPGRADRRDEHYPEDDDFEPTVAIAEEPERARSPSPRTSTGARGGDRA